MTPRSFVRTPSVSAEDVSEPAGSEFDSGDESLPPHTSEIGTLKKLPNHGTAWLGSSSGVYFVNTVRRAFSAALLDSSTAAALPASEDILTGEGADGRNYNGPVNDGVTAIEGDFRRVVLASLGRPPADRSLSMELVTSFFRCWHPLFPFMHGPRFLQDIETVYAMPDMTATASFTPAEARRIVTFQLIINIASLDRRDLQLPAESRIKSTSDVTRVAGCFSVDHDIAAIQLLIAAELYLVATIALRQASTVAGMILKLIYHAGLHRCPLRYASLSLEDCEIRRRIFWSAYALDRHLSLSLGDPNTVQDNDIDVCLSGRELHKAVAHELIIDPNDELKMHLPRPQAGPHGTGSPSDDPRVVNDGPQAREKAQRESAMTAYVHYGKLTGRIIEIFHKSIHARFQTPEAIVFLNSDIETWWNDLPSTLTDEDDDEPSSAPPPASQNQTPDQDSGLKNTPTSSTRPSSSNAAPTHKQLAPFFLILYHQLQLLLNRPRLSLDQSTAEFQHGLQICIKASRSTLTALKKHRDNGQSMLLPGLLSASWMAGLIIAFACQLGKYPKSRACADISACLTILESMGYSHWFTVKNCHKVLTLLLENIKSRKASSSGMLAAAPTQGIARKRTFDESTTVSESNTLSSPRRKTVTEMSPGGTSSDARMPPPAGTASRATSGTPTSTTTAPAGRRQRANRNGNANNSNPVRLSNPPSRPADFQTQSGSALYANPQDISLAQSSHDLNIPNTSSGNSSNMNPTTTSTSYNSSNVPYPPNSASQAFATQNEPLNIDDPLFWGNFDFNITDIFGAASWENMTGGTGSGGLFSGWGDMFGGTGAGPSGAGST